MSHTRLLFSLFAMMVSLCSWCYDFEKDGIYYNILSKTYKTVEVTRNNSYSGDVVIPASVNGYSVTNIGRAAFSRCSNLTSVSIPNSVTDIGESAFYACKLRSIVCKAVNAPSIYTKSSTKIPSSFSNQTLYHTTLFIPIGAWDNYAYDDDWYTFINIREAAMDAESVSNVRAFTIRDIDSDSYLCYDKVNGTIGTIGAEGLNEDEPNNSWMVTTVDGKQYVYNLGAKMYLTNVSANADKRHAVSALSAFTLTDVPTPVSISDGDSGVKFGNGEFYFVVNDNLNVELGLENKIKEATGIAGVASDKTADTPVFSVDGRKVTADKSGIIISNGKKYLMK